MAVSFQTIWYSMDGGLTFIAATGFGRKPGARFSTAGELYDVSLTQSMVVYACGIQSGSTGAVASS